jgi:hypothetical protein
MTQMPQMEGAIKLGTRKAEGGTPFPVPRSAFGVPRWAGLHVGVVLLVCTSGCLILPTPEFNSGKARANITKKTPARFELGKTTRAEVVLGLGEPDAVSPDESKLAYRSEKICGLWFVGGQGGGASGAFTKDRYLVAEFDARGVLLKLERSATWAGSSAAPTVLSQAAMADATAPAAASPQTAIRLQKPARWLAGMDGYKPAGATTTLGEPGQLLLSDSELSFVSGTEFANVGPALALPYGAIATVRVDKFGFGRRLVVRSCSGEVHAFEVLGPKGLAQDRQSLQSVTEFLQARIKP